jgi:hypothetical protein
MLAVLFDPGRARHLAHGDAASAVGAPGTTPTPAIRDFEAQSHGHHARCLRFALKVTLARARLAYGCWLGFAVWDFPTGLHQKVSVADILLLQALPGALPDRAASCRRPHRYRLSWAQALAKVFETDISVCPRCHQKGLQQIAVLTDARVLRAIVTAIERKGGPP